MTQSRLFLHIGLPRSATTALQRSVFPALSNLDYIGKAWHNNAAPLNGDAIARVRQILANAGENRKSTLESLGGVLMTILGQWKNANQRQDRAAARQFAQVWASAINIILASSPGRNFLFSDESLIESVVGLSSRLDHGYGIPLEQLSKTGLLKHAVVSVVLRDPADFLRASYYKNMEFEFKYKGKPIAFDEYIRRHISIYMRKPSASRIFMAMHKPFVAHLQQFCPTLIVNHYSKLIHAEHVLDALLGFQTGEQPVRLNDLPRENSTFRDDDAVKFILSANGIPSGISIEEYAKTFGDTLEHYGLPAIFKETALRTPNASLTRQ